MSAEFEVCRLPRLPDNPQGSPENHWKVLAERYRELRLDALRTAPDAFASSYEVERERDLEQTWQRLSNPKAINFIAISTKGDSSDPKPATGVLEVANEAEWVGLIVLIGPQDGNEDTVSAKQDPFAKMTAVTPAPPEAPIETETKTRRFHYHLNGVFVRPSARKAGLGRRLINAALAHAREEADAAGAGHKITIVVNEENRAARELYEKAGFVLLRSETYVQQPRALAGESHAEEKVALLMELDRSGGVG